MEGWMWIVLGSMFAVGAFLGFALGRTKGDDFQKVRELEHSLEESKAELEDYRQSVAEHFGKTAELFNRLTTDYREVYEHLAASSEALCGDQVPKISAQVPDSKLLDAEPATTEVEASQPESEGEKAAAVEEEKAEECASEPNQEEAKEAANASDVKEESENTELGTTAAKEEKTAEDAARTIH